MNLAEIRRRRNRVRDWLEVKQPKLWGRLGREQRELKQLGKLKRRKLTAKLKAAKAAAGPSKALKWARNQIGTTEHPAGTNRGPKIDVWIKACLGYLDGVAWCGCFAHHAAVMVAGVDGVTSSIRWAAVRSIKADSAAGTNGFVKGHIAIAKARPGDLVCFEFTGDLIPDHVGILVAVDGNVVECIEGNTSAANGGSQSNGGGVFARRRPISQVACVARPNYSKG